jgi:hypothetical protein
MEDLLLLLITSILALEKDQVKSSVGPEHGIDRSKGGPDGIDRSKGNRSDSCDIPPRSTSVGLLV